MKRLFFSVSVIAAAFGLFSCERHEWEDTKKLYESHDDHGHDDQDGGH